MSKVAVVKIGYFAEDTQAAINAGLNGFAVILLAESFGDYREKFPAGGIMFASHDHKGRPVYVTVSVDPPGVEERNENEGEVEPS